METGVQGDRATVEVDREGIFALVEESVTRDALDGIAGSSPAGPAGWAKLVDENIGWLRGWVRGRVRDPDLVHDICQDSFLKAFRSLGELKDASRFSSWLYRIAENTLRDHLRRKVRRGRWLTLSDDLDRFEAPAGASERAGDAEEAERLLAIIRGLPPRYREPLLLRHSRELSYAEIGQILGIRENAVQVRIFRARKMLREKLERDERLRQTLSGGRPEDAGDRGGST